MPGVWSRVWHRGGQAAPAMVEGCQREAGIQQEL